MLVPLALQTSLSTDVIDHLLEARLSQLMGVGFVIIAVVVLVVLVLFWRMMNGQDAQIRNNGALIDKLATLPTVAAGIAEQNALLRRQAEATEAVKASNDAIAALLQAGATSDDDTQHRLDRTLAEIAALSTNVIEGRKVAVEEVKGHMDENARTTDERFAALEQEMKEVSAKLDRLLALIEPNKTPPAVEEMKTPDTPPMAPADAPPPSTAPIAPPSSG